MASATTSSSRGRATRPTIRRASRGVRLPERSPEKHSLEHFERFCFSLRLPDGAGPFRLQDAQLAKLEDYFSVWEDGRLVRPGILESLWHEPTGAGKSTLLGALALHHGTYVRPNPNVFVLGGLGNHGRNTLDAAAGFVERSTTLSRWWVAQEYGMGRLKSLMEHKGVIKVSSAGRRVGGRGGSSQEGSDPTLILVEEDHRHEDNGAAVATLISKMQKRSAMGSQVQIVHATTSGDSKDSALGRLIDRALDEDAGSTVERDRRPGEYYVRAVDGDGDLVMHSWAVPDEIQPPQKGASREDVDEYLKHVKRACPMDMVTLRSLRLTWKALSAEPWVFMRQNANQWVTQDFAAIDRVGWNAGNRGADLSIPAGAERVFVGLDTAIKWDTTAIMPVWIDPRSKRPRTAGAVLLRSPHPGAKRRMRDAVDVLEVMRQRWPKMTIVFDRSKGGGLIAEQLEEDFGLTIVDHEQGSAFDLASMRFGELVDQHNFDHDGNGEVTAQVLAAVARRSHYGRRWRVEQPQDGRPIDACAALVMATNVAMTLEEDQAARPFNPADYRIETL